jgi:hypothetical protein
MIATRTLPLLVCAAMMLATDVGAAGPIAPIESGFGADGPHEIIADSVPAKRFGHKTVHVFRPSKAEGPRPVTFLFPAFRSWTPTPYMHLIRHLVSRGNCVVFAPYRLAQFPYQNRTYRRMYEGALAGLALLGAHADTTRVGFAGHSFGGSAVPRFAWEALEQRGWGTRGAYLYVMAPFFMFYFDEQRLGRFPSQTKLIVQVYEDDDCNDHRMAKDLFEHIDIHPDEKDFVIVRTDICPVTGYTLRADHATPFCEGDSEGEVDGLDYYGVFRLMDALQEYAFTASRDAKAIALGNGGDQQRFMGVFPDGTPVRTNVVSDNAPLVRPQSYYYFKWSHPWNLRRRWDHVRLSDPWER